MYWIHLNSRLWRGNVALFRIIAFKGNSNAIIPEKHCMKCTCRNLRIIQWWNVALSVLIQSRNYSMAIASKKNCMTCTCRNLSIWSSGVWRRNVALSKSIAATSRNMAYNHFGEALHDRHQLKLVCMEVPHVKECRQLSRNHWYRKQWRSHRFGEALYSNCGQKSRCMTFQYKYLIMEFCIVLESSFPSHNTAIIAKEHCTYP